jgi:ABC-type lipoprotein release transport system permease subunit
LVVRHGVVAAGLGIALGVTLALTLSSRLQPLLFRTEARDPLVFAATAALVLVIALAASVLPGRRATRADPLEALRAD